MKVLIVGVVCIVVVVVVLLLLWLCSRSKQLKRFLQLKDKESTPILQLPDLTVSYSNTQCVQPRFEEGSLYMVPHLIADDEKDDFDGKEKQRLGGIDPDELRGRLHGILSPLSCGLLDFSIYYDTETKHLYGVIFCVRELPMVRDRLPNALIQVELACTQQYVYCTALKRESSSPIYNEPFQFGPIDLNDLVTFGMLHFQVFHIDHTWKDRCLAFVDVPLSDFPTEDLIEDELSICRALIKSDSEPFIRPHQVYSISRSSSTETTFTNTLPRSGQETPYLQETSRLQYRQQSPQIYLTSTTGAKTMLEANDGVRQRRASMSEMTSLYKQSQFSKQVTTSSPAMLQLSLLYDRGTARLIVIVLKAKYLQLQPGGLPPNVLLKLYIYNTVTQQKFSKKAAEIQRRTTDPVFNESFSFRLPESSLSDYQLVISIVDATEKSRLRHRSIGDIVLGCNVDGESNKKHWLSATHGDGIGKQVTMWHVF